MIIKASFKSFFLFITLCCSGLISLAQVRQLVSIDDSWLFQKESEPQSRLVDIPHTWNIKDVMDDEPDYYRALGIYKRSIKFEESWKNKEIYLCFDGANQESKVFINGEKVGEHIGGYNQFRYRITSFLNPEFSKNNEIRVEVNNKFNPDIPPLTADFTFFGGIYRHVYLLVVNKIHFADPRYGSNGVYINSPSVNKSNAQLSIKGNINNLSSNDQLLNVETKIFNAQNELVDEVKSDITIKANEHSTFSQQIDSFKNPKLWSPENPYRYRFVTKITNHNNEELDVLTNFFGFRWFHFDADKGFFLNDKSYKLLGASRHQDYENLGNAVPDSLQIQDVKLLKQMGANFLRVAHYPQNQVVLNACDSLGILTSIEIPVVNQITESEAFFQNANEMQIEMIRQNYNHPSVVIWGYMNEVLLRLPFSGDKDRQDIYLNHVAELAQKLENTTHIEDSSRYTMIANHGSFGLYERAGLLKIPQLIGWNLYNGWYSGKIEDFAKNLDDIHKKLPDKPFIISEFGADADPRIRSLTPEKFDKSVEYAVKFHQEYLKAIDERKFVAGGAMWNLADFNSETREETMPHINNKGLLTYSRKAKDTYYLYQAHLLKAPFIKLSNWKIRAGKEDEGENYSTQEVLVFSNASTVKMILNGKELGLAKVKENVAQFQLPFKDGINNIEVTGDNGVKDQIDISFNLIPKNLFQTGLGNHKLSILLGAKRSFIDAENKELWIPDQPYEKGSWGSIGGRTYQIPKSSRQSYGTDRNIKSTDNDPIYQTQNIGISEYKIDVPNGKYNVNLFFSEFFSDKQIEGLIYNLDNTKQEVKAVNRIFNVTINGKPVLKNFNITSDYGELKAISKEFKVKAKKASGIDIKFIPVEGEPILNAIQLEEIDK